MMVLDQLKKSKQLIIYTGFNLLDKGLVFLLPLLLLTLFKVDSIYVQLEYIISIVNIYATFTDLGINGYMFFLYRNESDKNAAVDQSRQTSEFIFLILIVITALLFLIHYFIHPIHALILFVSIRIAFIYITSFFTAYFRLIDKPVYAIYVSLAVNLTSVFLTVLFFTLDEAFNLWLIFMPQGILIIYYLLKLIFEFKISAAGLHATFSIILRALKFSWPSIVQVFLMVFMANYGKINALDKLSSGDAVFLGYTLRFCMIIQLAHASLVGFYAKSILSGEGLLSISGRIIKLYAGVLLLCYIFVITIMWIYQAYVIHEQDLTDRFLLVILFSLYTLFWCFYSYLEMYYARINKNHIKLYLTFIIIVIFILILNFSPFGLLLNIAYAMFLSILSGLIANILVLRKLQFKLG